MNNLEEVVINRINEKIRYGAKKGATTLNRLIEESNNSHDFIAYLGGQKRQMSFSSSDTFNMELHRGNTLEIYTVNPHAVSQLGAKLDIPTAYLKKLITPESQDWQKELAATMLNKHTEHAKQNRLLVRAVGDNVRGVLSDSYRRLNSVDLITSFMQTIQDKGAVLCDGLMTDTKIFLEAIMPSPVAIETPNNGTVHITFGVRISTSDYGDGALELRSFYMQGVCLNGMVRESMLKQVHLGSKLPENITFSEQTYRSDTKTQALAIRDISQTILSDAYTKKRCEEILRASEKPVDLEEELDKLSKVKITKDEAKAVKKIFQQNDPMDGVAGSATLWKLTQGLTSYANKITDGLRTRELHEIAGEIIKRA